MSKCWFCNKRNADAKSKLTVKMYRAVTQDRTGLYPVAYVKRTQYEIGTVPISRCARCKTAIGNAQMAGYLLFFMIFGGGFCACSSWALSERIIWPIIWGIFGIGSVIMIFWLPNKIIHEAGIEKLNLFDVFGFHPEADHPTVKRLKEQGWAVGEPS